MYCRNCGNQVPDGARFCTGCGTQLMAGGMPAQTATRPQTPQPAAASKKKWGLLRAIAFGILAAVLTTVVIPAFLSGQKPKLPDIEDDGITSAAYSAAFSQHFLVPPVTAFLGSDSAHYVLVSDEGMGVLDNMEFAYEDGVITALCETLYMIVDGAEESSKKAAHDTIMTSLAAYDVMEECTVTYDLGSRVYTYTVLITNLDDRDVLTQCNRLGLLEVEDTNAVVGIKLTEDNLLAAGYIKR